MNDSVFLSKTPVRGIISIKNLTNGKIFLTVTENALKAFKNERFALDMGMHDCQELQEEYTETGLEVFVIELDQEAGKDDDLTVLLEERKDYYRRLGALIYK